LVCCHASAQSPAAHQHDAIFDGCLLPCQKKTICTQNFNDFFCIANWMVLAQGRESSSNLAPLPNFIGDGSNQSVNASLAFSTASASVSPALAQPGNSGKTADHLLVLGSNSMSSRNFITEI
jgi:hypothetical protein